MSRTFYSLRIWCEEDSYDNISRLLGVEPQELGMPKEWWIYEVIQKEKDEYFDFINRFLDLLEGKYLSLEDLGISRKNIAIWMIYEYDNQCNMEYRANDLKRLGNNGIDLCISCYQTNDENWTIRLSDE